jgi:RHS repeat-associated protein
MGKSPSVKRLAGGNRLVGRGAVARAVFDPLEARRLLSVDPGSPLGISPGGWSTNIYTLNSGWIAGDQRHRPSRPTEFDRNRLYYRGSDGSALLTSTDLESSGFGMSWSVSRSWSNSSNTQNFHGKGWSNAQIPQLASVHTFASLVSVSFAFGVEEPATFDHNVSSGTFTPTSPRLETLTVSGSELLLARPDGSVLRFYHVSSDTDPRAGRLKEWIAPGGQVTTLDWDADGRLQSVVRSNGKTGSEFRGERFKYSYTDAADYAGAGNVPNVGLIEAVELQQKTSETGEYATVRSVKYTYFPDVPSDYGGLPGNLRTVTIHDGGLSSAVVSQKHYRYYTTSGSPGYLNGLQLALDSEAFATFKAQNPSVDIETANSSTLAPYADHQFTYDSSKRLTSTKSSARTGNTAAGVTQRYTYETIAGTSDAHVASSSFTVTDDDGDSTTLDPYTRVYSNYKGRPLMVIRGVALDGSNVKLQRTAFTYDSLGRIDLVATADSVTNHTAGHDVLAWSGTQSGHIDDWVGLVYDYDYATSTTATESTAGTVKGMVSQVSIRRGETGIASVLSSMDYLKRTAGSGPAFVIVPASATTYRPSAEGAAITTNYAYTWWFATTQARTVRVDEPAVPTSHGGSGTSTSVRAAYDSVGQMAWTQDQSGFVNRYTYDDLTGGVVGVVRDIGEVPSESDWTLNSGTRLALLTTVEVDKFGRPTYVADRINPTDANDLTTRATAIVWNDVANEVRVYEGWNASNGSVPVPVQLYRTDAGRKYSEVVSYLPTLNQTSEVLNGRPKGNEPITNITSAVRYHNDDSGRVTHIDRYSNVNSLAYDVAASWGASGTNFDRTEYGYDVRGNVSRVLMPTGTIYRYEYDAMDRLVRSLVGTNDASGQSNMVETASLVYADTHAGAADGIASGLLQSYTLHPTADATDDRTTTYYYDWRNRLVASHVGSNGGSDNNLQSQLTYLTLDHLGQITEVDVYDGDNTTLTSTNGVPNKPSESKRHSRFLYDYDALGRIYKTRQVLVNQSNGAATDTRAITESWVYDPRGNVAKWTGSGGLTQKVAYDGAGRANTVYLGYDTDDIEGGTAYTGSMSVDGDTILEQYEYVYDGSDNVILAKTRQRFHDASGTGALGTPASTTPIAKARVYSTAYFYNDANQLIRAVDVGTFGGSEEYDSDDRTNDATADRDDDHLITTWTYHYPENGSEVRVTNPRGIESRISYDAAGRVTKTVEAWVNGAVELTDFDEDDDRTTTYTYNGIDRLTSIRAYFGSGLFQETAYIYGAINGTNGSTMTSNDVLTAVWYPDKAAGTASNSAEKESWGVNRLGEAVSYTDRRGVVHDYKYDKLGRLGSDWVTDFGASDEVDESINRITYAFDPAGRLYAVTSRNTASYEEPHDDRNIINRVQYTYNGFGQLTHDYQERDGMVDGSTKHVQYAYTEANGVTHSRLTSMIYPDGRTIDFAYDSGTDDAISRLSAIKQSGDTLESYSYLGLQSLAGLSRPEPGVSLAFHGTGTGTADGDPYGGIDRFGRIGAMRWQAGSTDLDWTQYTYDRNGNRKTKDVKTPGAPTDGANQTDELYVYDRLDRLIEARRGTLDSTGINMPTVSWLGGWELDALGNVKQYLTVNNPLGGDANLDGNVDFADQLLLAQNYSGGGNGTWGQADFDGDGATDFDDLMIFTQANGSTGLGVATYQGRSHNRQNQISEMWTDTNRDGVKDTGETVTAIGYDAEGNNTQDAQGQTLVYDAWNRMVAIKVGSTVKIAYEYDGLFRRIQETVGSTTHSQYYSASWQVIEERIDDEVRVQNVWSAVYIDAMVLRDRDSDANGTLDERVYPLFDANFNVSSIIDDEGAVLERYRYEPYGDRVVLNADFTPDTLAGSDSTTSDDTEAGWNTSDVLFRHGHQGGAYDRVASEKMLFRFRTLDTQQMRWGQVDPLTFVDGMNNYEYVNGNPQFFVDSNGLQASPTGAGSAAPCSNCQATFTKRSAAIQQKQAQALTVLLPNGVQIGTAVTAGGLVGAKYGKGPGVFVGALFTIATLFSDAFLFDAEYERLQAELQSARDARDRCPNTSGGGNGLCRP